MQKIRVSLKILKKQNGSINNAFNKYLCGELQTSLNIINKIIIKKRNYTH